MRRAAIVTAAILLLAAAVPAQVLNLPPRPPGAKSGSQVKADIENLARQDRENQVLDEIMSGNVPDYLRALKPVTVSATIGGTPHTVTYYVTPDYLSVGIEGDFFRMPMTPILAQWIADRTQCVMPTRKMVNDIWSVATVKMDPQPIPPSAQMITVPVFYTHHQMVESSRTQLGKPLGPLIAGIKKDVCISPVTPTKPSPLRVAIYGWHYISGTPIQPLSWVHENTYADYSHGIRLVQSQMLLDGVTTTVESVWAHPTLCALLSDEGVVTPPRYQVPPAPTFPYADAFPAAGRELEGLWTDRFTVPAVVAFIPIAPGGDGFVMRVRDSSGGIETTRLGRLTDTDYFVEALIYCNHRPGLAADGFERLGIFARDNGNGMFEGISGGGIQGTNYALTWDSADGRVQCLRTVAGVATDLLAAPQFLASSAWRRFRIEALGNQIAFKLDGATLVSVTDSAHPQGQFGIGYHDYFATNANILGTYAENFSAGALINTGVGEWARF